MTPPGRVEPVALSQVGGNVAEVVARYPELGRLVDLEAAGWSFIHRFDAEGVDRVDAFREWPDGWLDCLRVRSATDAMALRSAGGDPPAMTWEKTGGLVEVVGELLTLPAPDERTAPRLVLGAALRLWTPGGWR
ncbi:hypothetical protein F4560_007978 [Saccharothrix ecbatanensis]|uniref:Uncharacterized protein n=1 Tax=Saccharothrix ecbatanensis TaxID=1105145 RepID=A0A7W9M5K0_9PSEU|nr:hypothetical protein [Saccharothrix ecbatanensis]MBB5808210.1 hypothetical protein [Saccharothrix ecbatanensis]